MSSKSGGAAGALGEVSIESAKMTGKSWFDPAAGMLAEGAGRHEMVIKMSPGGQPVTSKTEQELSHRLVEIQTAKK